MVNRIFASEQSTQQKESNLSATLDSVRGMVPQLKTVAKSTPIAVIALGAVAGIALGWWVKRR